MTAPAHTASRPSSGLGATVDAEADADACGDDDDVGSDVTERDDDGEAIAVGEAEVDSGGAEEARGVRDEDGVVLADVDDVMLASGVITSLALGNAGDAVGDAAALSIAPTRASREAVAVASTSTVDVGDGSLDTSGVADATGEVESDADGVGVAGDVGAEVDGADGIIDAVEVDELDTDTDADADADADADGFGHSPSTHRLGSPIGTGVRSTAYEGRD